ncbi:nitroreductase family protein [Anaeromicropila herbilytica]|uniref:Nitroreductase n=1 Tax=Anaeromicropila herbilytica TaxID=2785025 RepID=A0A7R7ELY9_9FIRM|nr:nitroreductase family protein [Anaeromicropila herbilytica]BCN30932.1 nitroreductase [Anaeromicropila herbilytica]
MEIFNTEIIKDESGRLTYIELPFNAKEVFDKQKGAIFVIGTINDVPYRNKLISRGGGKQIMTIDKSMQKELDFIGEKMSVHITMAPENNEIENENSLIPSLSVSSIDVVTAIKTRRSIRKFTSEPISESMLNTVLQSGMYAPSAKGKCPCHFVVIQNRDMLMELSESNYNASMLGGAACGIVVCGDKNIEGIKEFIYADCAAAVQNMLLSIHGLGLGGVWCGVRANSDWHKLIVNKLNLPLKVDPFAIIAFGHPDEERVSRELWDASSVHYDIW